MTQKVALEQTHDIVQSGRRVLRCQAAELSLAELQSPEIQHLIVGMRDAMRKAPGVGLAAPQFGHSLQIAVIEVSAEILFARTTAEERAVRDNCPVDYHVIVNPRIIVTDPTPLCFFEGCLSLIGFRAMTPRARGVRVEALNEHGESVCINATGWHARILQHEIDHLSGHLYVDRMLSRTFMSEDEYKAVWAGVAPDEIRRQLNA